MGLFDRFKKKQEPVKTTSTPVRTAAPTIQFYNDCVEDYHKAALRPKVRPYQTNNYYAVLIRQAQAEMEVNHIVYGEKSVPKNRKKKPE